MFWKARKVVQVGYKEGKTVDVISRRIVNLLADFHRLVKGPPSIFQGTEGNRLLFGARESGGEMGSTLAKVQKQLQDVQMFPQSSRKE